MAFLPVKDHALGGWSELGPLCLYSYAYCYVHISIIGVYKGTIATWKSLLSLVIRGLQDYTVGSA